MKRVLVFLYGVVAYLFFFGSFTYCIGFVGNILVPKGIDSGALVSLPEALIVNLILLNLFVVQHTVMARPAFKKWWTRIIPEPMERSTYVLASSLILILIMWQWRPIAGEIWRADSYLTINISQFFFWVGWVVVLASSFMINHFELFGLKQVTAYLRGQEPVETQFKKPALYKYVRHPLMLGFLIAVWATPVMTVGHMVFSIGITGYILVGTWFEERDLVRALGETYRQYQKEVPKLIPWPRKR